MSAPLGTPSGIDDAGFTTGAAGDTDIRTSVRTDRRPSGDQSIGSLIAEVADDVSKLFRQEVELAKAELKQEATKAGKAAGMLGGAGFAGYMAVLFASLALMFGLAAIMPIGWSAVIVMAIWGIAAAALFVNGRKRMRTVSPVPQQTVETLKEDARWLRHPTE
jgi:hypothetical protein